jgi:hypothetical protein
MTTCPSCGQNTPFSTERANSCDCGFRVWYRDTYAETERAERGHKAPAPPKED